MKKHILSGVIALSLLSFITGCFGGKNNPETDISTTAPKTDIASVDTKTTAPVSTASENTAPAVTENALKDGVTLTGLYMSHQGMAMEPYYILQKTENGIYMKITNCRPDDYNMLEDVDYDEWDNISHYFGFIDTVKDCEYASLVTVDDDVLKRIEKILADTGAAEWDGFSESRSMDGVLDAGDSYDLYLTFSDGSSVKVDGYNAHPKGWDDMFSAITDIFDENKDYSRYMLTEFPSSGYDFFSIKFYEHINYETQFSVEMRPNTSRFSFYIRDPWGKFTEKGTDLGNYYDDFELPYERFVKLLNEYHAEKWNGISDSSGSEEEHFSILIYSDDGKEFSASGNVFPEGMKEFRAAFINELLDYYNSNIKDRYD